MLSNDNSLNIHLDVKELSKEELNDTLPVIRKALSEEERKRYSAKQSGLSTEEYDSKIRELNHLLNAVRIQKFYK